MKSLTYVCPLAQRLGSQPSKFAGIFAEDFEFAAWKIGRTVLDDFLQQLVSTRLVCDPRPLDLRGEAGGKREDPGLDPIKKRSRSPLRASGTRNGIWTRERCLIITADPNSLVRRTHNRMPAIYDRAMGQQWLERDLSFSSMNLRRGFGLAVGRHGGRGMFRC